MKSSRTAIACFLSLALVGAAGCGADAAQAGPSDPTGPTGPTGPSPTELVVQVVPASATVVARGSASFTAAVTGTAVVGVTWTVREATGGTIDASGRYVAPQGTGTYHVVATSVADPLVSASATVTVTAAPSTGGGPVPGGGPVVAGGDDNLAAIDKGAAQCAAAPLSGSPIYYFCECATGGPSDAQPDPACSPGNDASAGTSPSSPWRSWSKIVSTFQTMPAGATVALCRGGAWDVSSGNIRRNNNCYNVGKTSYCTMRDYVAPFNTGSAARPVLWNNGRSSARGPFNFDDSSTTTHGNYRFHNMYFRNTASSHWVWTFFYNDARNVEFCNNVWNGSNNAFQVTIGPGCGAGSDCNKGALINFNYLRNLSDFGMLAQGTDWTIAYNDFDNTGGTSNREHAIYMGANGGHTVKNMKLIGNRVVNSVHNSTGSCMGSPIVVHGFYDGLTVSNNYVEEPNGLADGGCWGIEIDSNAEGTGNFFRNVTVSGNIVKNVGNQGIILSNSQNVLIENNVVINTRSRSMTGIKGDDHRSSSGDAAGQNITIRNNTVYYGPGSSGTGISLDSAGSNFLFNNVVSGSTGVSCLSTGSVTQGANLCATSGSPAASTLFANPGVDFSLPAGSALIGGGSSSNYSPADITGKARSSTAPSIGAYEP